MKRSVQLTKVFSAALLLFPTVYAAEPEQVSFEDLPRLVQGQNREVSAAELSIQSASANTGFFGRSFLPSIRLEGGSEVFKTGSEDWMSQPFGAFELKVNLFRSGRDWLEEEVRQAEVTASRMERDRTVAETLNRARKAYWHLVFQREVVALYEEAAELNARNAAAAEKRIRSGLATETDRLDFEINRLELQQEFAKAKVDYSTAARELGAVLGQPKGAGIEAKDKGIAHRHDETLLLEGPALDQHRDVQLFLAKQSAADHRKSKERRWWTPSVDGFANYSLYTFRERENLLIRDRFETVAGVKVSFDIFDGLQASAAARSAAAEAQSFENRAFQRQTELESDLENRKQEIKLIHEQIELSEKNIERRRRYLAGTLSEYSRGVKNSPDVLEATQRLIEQKLHSAELRKNYEVVRAELLAILAR